MRSPTFIVKFTTVKVASAPDLRSTQLLPPAQRHEQGLPGTARAAHGPFRHRQRRILDRLAMVDAVDKVLQLLHLFAGLQV